MNILATVEAFARSAHEGQRRKYANEPYINHPVRVMHTCAEYVNDEVVLEAALLHDVIEDTEVSANMLFKFLQTLHSGPEAVKVMKLVQELTDEYVSAKYPGWNRVKRKKLEVLRLSKISPAAQTIKYADILDNSTDIVNSGSDFAPRYLLEAEDILLNLPKGNAALYKRTLETVRLCRKQLSSPPAGAAY